LKVHLDTEIFCYIGRRVEFDNVLPSIDDIYTEFQTAFEIHGCNEDVMEEMIDMYVRSTNLDGVDIQWEGDIHESRYKRAAEDTSLPSKTA
jgi:hypothetical protein